jgi:hypothetical protein
MKSIGWVKVLAGLALIASLTVVIATAQARGNPVFGTDDPVGRVRAEMRFAVPADVAQRVSQSGQSYPDFGTISDDSQALSTEVPRDWQETETGPWMIDGNDHGVFLSASSDLHEMGAGRASGVFIGAFHSHPDSGSVAGILEWEKQQFSAHCKQNRRIDYQTAFHAGQIDHFFACGGGPTNVLIGVVSSGDGRYFLIIRLHIHDQRDLVAAERVLNSIQVLGEPGHDDHHEH